MFNRLERFTRGALTDQETTMQDPEFAAAVTHCLSCGQNRSANPWRRGSPLPPVVLDTTAPGTVPENTIRATKQQANAGLRPARPVSAGKVGQLGDTESTMSSS